MTRNDNSKIIDSIRSDIFCNIVGSKIVEALPAFHQKF